MKGRQVGKSREVEYLVAGELSISEGVEEGQA